LQGMLTSQASPALPMPAVAPEPGMDIGDARLYPALRKLVGPIGTAALEPRVLQVLKALAEARGSVVRRESLLQSCWPGLVVGEDSLNRAIAEVRKALRVAGGSARVETIPRGGYRLCFAVAVAADPSLPVEPVKPTAVPGDPSIPRSRRRFVLAAGLCVTGLVGIPAGFTVPRRATTRVTLLLAQAREVMREDRWGAVDPLVLLDEAVRLDPADADAWGLTALARRDLVWSNPSVFESMANCSLAAKQALSRDPEQPDAQVALATLAPCYGDWFAAEQRLVPLVRRYPDNEAAWVGLGKLHAEAGHALEHRETIARLVHGHPLSPRYAADEIHTLWASGMDREMDRRADAALRAWPDHRGVWRARVETLGFSGRPDRALDLIARNGLKDEDYPPLVARALIAAFKAFAGIASISDAVAASMAAGAARQSSAVRVIPVLASLGAIREAFDLADAYFLGRGPVRLPNRFGASTPGLTDTRDRLTSTLFAPPARRLWSDARFAALCREIGLLDYWRSSGTGPFLLGTRPFRWDEGSS